MTPLMHAVMKTGLVSTAQLDEFSRWGMDIHKEGAPEVPVPLDQASQMIEQALHSEGYVLTKETDLNILAQYLATQTDGLLHVEVLAEDLSVETSSSFPVTFGRTLIGEYILPWKGEAIQEEMINGMTYLQVEGSDPVFFSNVKELFYGDTKAFMVCTQRTG